jgi:DNA invertase Pin-like site-specific DNA recombinase
MPKYYAYLRVSTKQQASDKATGFSRQLDTIHAYCRKNNIVAANVFSEIWTGSETRRPAYTKMLKSVKAGDTILCESVDRYSRAGFLGFGMMLDLMALGCDLIDCSTGESLAESLNGHPLSRFLFQVRLLVSELERNSIVHRCQSGLKRARKKNGGKPVQGRKRFYSPQLKRRVKRLLRTHTTAYVADLLQREGVNTVDSRPWTQQKVRRLVR